MRARSLPALILGLACLACDPIGLGNSSSEADSAGRPLATITLASAGGDDCSARWNGEAANQDEIMRRGIAALEEALTAIGGIANITGGNMPFVRVEAPPDLAYSCLGATLRTLQRSGFAWIVLRPADGGGPDARADFFLPGTTEPQIARPAVAVGRGSLSLDGTPTDLAGIRTRLRALSEGEEPPPEAVRPDAPPPMISAPNSFVVQVAGDAAFGELYGLVRTVAAAGETATLVSCAGPDGPQGLAAC